MIIEKYADKIYLKIKKIKTMLVLHCPYCNTTN